MRRSSRIDRLAGSAVAVICLTVAPARPEPAEADADKRAAPSMLVRTWRDGCQLDIPDRNEAREAPREGWCGEACIQMAALYYGCYAPQSVINKLGQPKHPDLYSDDLPVAMEALGLTHERSTKEARDLRAFVDWVRGRLRRERPVLLGVKNQPDRHPDWSCDHFVLAAGFRADRFLLNTNNNPGGQLQFSVARLSSTAPGLSLVNRLNQYLGIAITGTRTEETDLVPVGLRVAAEDQRRVALQICIGGLTRGQEYVLAKFDGAAAAATPRKNLKRANEKLTFKARGTSHVTTDTVLVTDVALYRCFPVR